MISKVVCTAYLYNFGNSSGFPRIACVIYNSKFVSFALGNKSVYSFTIWIWCTIAYLHPSDGPNPNTFMIEFGFFEVSQFLGLKDRFWRRNSKFSLVKYFSPCSFKQPLFEVLTVLVLFSNFTQMLRNMEVRFFKVRKIWVRVLTTSSSEGRVL